MYYVFIVKKPALAWAYKYIVEHMDSAKENSIFYAKCYECKRILESAMDIRHNYTDVISFAMNEESYNYFIVAFTEGYRLKRGLKGNLKIIPIEELNDGSVKVHERVDLE